ncbi:hypothetical protein [Spirosoma harenae]
MKIVFLCIRVITAIFIIGWWLIACMAAYGAWLYFSDSGRP